MQELFSDPYEAIVSLLENNNAQYRIVEHEPVGQSLLVSNVRGSNLSQGAKAMVVMVKTGKKTRKYYLAVIPADRRVNFDTIKRIAQGTYAAFASEDIAKKLTNCVMGAVPPFSFHPELELLVDPILLENEEIVFNAGRLDRSIFLSSDSYKKIANMTLKNIASTDN
jgi:Ala-tRNA(Pro) deacylase